MREDANLYESFSAEVYDHVVPYAAREDIDFYVDESRRCGGEVLEIGCGSGRVLLPIARAGVAITGVDHAEAMLARCHQKLKQESQDLQDRVRLHKADMRAFDLGRRFALITTPFRVFQLVTSVEEQLATLACLRRHLSADGRLILDLYSPRLDLLASDVTGVEQAHEPEFILPDGRRVVRCHRILERDLARQVMHAEFVYHVTLPRGEHQTIRDAFRMRWIFRYEAEHLLARAGFRVEAVYADFSRQSYDEGLGKELILVASLAE